MRARLLVLATLGVALASDPASASPVCAELETRVTLTSSIDRVVHEQSESFGQCEFAMPTQNPPVPPDLRVQRGRGVHINADFPVDRLRVRLRDLRNDREHALKVVRRGRGWTVRIPASTPRGPSGLILRFFDDGKLSSQWLPGLRVRG